MLYSLHTRLHTHLPATSCHTISLYSQHTHFSIKESLSVAHTHTHMLPVLKRTGRQTVFLCTHSHLCKHTLRVNTPVCVLASHTPPLTHWHSVIQIISLLPDLHAHFIPVRHTLSPSTHTHTHLQTRGKLISLTDSRLAAWRAEGAEKVITRDRRTCVGFTSSFLHLFLPPPPLFHSNLHLSQLPSHRSHWRDLIGRLRCFRDRFHVDCLLFFSPPSAGVQRRCSTTGGAVLCCVCEVMLSWEDASQIELCQGQRHVCKGMRSFLGKCIVGVFLSIFSFKSETWTCWVETVWFCRLLGFF